MKFIRKKLKRKHLDTVTYINSCRMPYYNSVLLALYAYEEDAFRDGYSVNLTHAYWALEYVTDGEFVFAGERGEYRLKSGDFAILYPGGKYRMSVPKGMTGEKKVIMLNNSPLISLLCNQSSLNGQEVVRLKEREPVEQLFLHIARIVTAGNGEKFTEQELTNAIFAIFTELIAQNRPVSSHDAFAARLNNPHDFIALKTLDEVADYFQMGKWTLTRMFKKHLNCTPYRYLIYARMRHAAQLLASNTLTIKEISEECGYRSPSLFCAEFKKYFRKTPLEFRNEKPVFSDDDMRQFETWS